MSTPTASVTSKPALAGDAMGRRSVWWLVAFGSILAALFVYRATFLTMVDKWNDDAAFAYGFAVVPIVLWLGWRRRDWLSRVRLAPSWLGAAALLAAGALWVVGRGAGVLSVEQAATAAMIPALVLAVLGTQAVRALLFPLAFLVFLVPFGRAVVPQLVDITADFATLLLEWSGIPVYRTHALITIPGGWFLVARACSGVSFLMTAVVLGSLYAHLNFNGWRKRVIAVLLACAIPIVANALRVYITIAVSHLTDMRFGPGAEHVTFGNIFFICIMLATMWIGRRWHDEPAGMPHWLAAAQPARRDLQHPLHWAIVAAALVLIVVPPWYYARATESFHMDPVDAAASIRLPRAADGWNGPDGSEAAWRPLYRGTLAEQSGSYVRGGSDRVDVFVGVYGVGVSQGNEMVQYSNVLYPAEKEVVPESVKVTLELAGRSLELREVVVDDGSGWIVWYWYVVGDTTATNPFYVKALEALNWLTRSARSERIVTLATPGGAGSSARLQAFADAHSSCVASGFAAEACIQ